MKKDQEEIAKLYSEGTFYDYTGSSHKYNSKEYLDDKIKHFEYKIKEVAQDYIKTGEFQELLILDRYIQDLFSIHKEYRNKYPSTNNYAPQFY